MSTNTTNITTKKAEFEADQMIKVKSMDDFGALVGGEVALKDNYHYQISSSFLGGPITAPLRIPTGATVKISNENPVGFLIGYVGGGAMIRGVAIESLIMENLVLIDFFGSQTLFDLTGTAASSVSVELAAFNGFASLGVIDTFQIVFLEKITAQGNDNGFVFKNIEDLEFLGTQFTNSSPSVGAVFISLAGVFDRFNIADTFFEPKAGEAAINIDPMVQFNRASIADNPFSLSSGGEFFKSGVTGNITGFADSVTSPGVKTTVTSTSHGLSNGQTLFLTEVTNFGYEGGYSISNVTANAFDIDATFIPGSGSGTGSWDTGSLAQGDRRINVINNGDQQDSRVVAVMTMEANASVTVINSVNVWEKVAGTTVGYVQNERAKMTGNNKLTFKNLSRELSTVSVALTAIIQGGVAKDCEFGLFLNGALVQGFVGGDELTNKGKQIAFPVKVSHIDGDFVEVYARNITDASDILVTRMSVVL